VALASSYLVGLALAIVVLLGHSVQGTSFATSAPKDADEWCAHQIAGSADFGLDNRLLTSLTGALNHQVAHHLFPSISHVHYPALAPRLEAVFARYGVSRTVHPTLGAALKAHRALLARLGAHA